MGKIYEDALAREQCRIDAEKKHEYYCTVQRYEEEMWWRDGRIISLHDILRPEDIADIVKHLAYEETYIVFEKRLEKRREKARGKAITGEVLRFRLQRGEREFEAMPTPVYCKKFNNECREHNRDKYDRKCFLCGKDECYNRRRLSVHHVDMNKTQGCDGVKWKLVPLCASCHFRSHTYVWQARIEYLLDNVWE